MGDTIIVLFMRIISGVVPVVSRLSRVGVELSRKARQKLKWFDYYDSRGRNARLTCRHFDISPQTFYRWKKRYNRKDLASLEDGSHRPCHFSGRFREEDAFPGEGNSGRWWSRV